MRVEIINPEVVSNLYSNHGTFACVCYGTPETDAEKVGKSCEKSGHMSGSRCEYIKFRIFDVDRGTAEQCLRHEIGTSIPFEMQDNYNFSEYSDRVIDINPSEIVKNMASFRYIDKENFRYATPVTIKKCGKANAVYENLMAVINSARREIKEALEETGVDSHKASQDANFVLPRATTTDLVIGFTPEALIHFCHKRLCSRAQEFIHELAQMMKAEIEKYSPEFARELIPHCQYLMWCPEGAHSCHAYPTRDEVLQELSRQKVTEATEATE